MANNPPVVKRAVQQNLFEDLSIEVPVEEKALVRVLDSESGEAASLRKRFNSQAQKIERLRRRIEERTKDCVELLSFWGEKLAPLEVEIGELQMRLAFAIEAQSESFKLGSRQRADVGEAIVGLLDEAFGRCPATEEAQELFGRWNELSFDEERELQQTELAETMSELIHETYGIDLELDPELLRAGPEALAQKVEEAVKEASPEEMPRRRKTKKQREKEEQERLAEELAAKSLRSLYISLAKLLHPDAERDESAKAEKEAIMKEVTSAYEAGDLHSLLRLELEWVNRESSHMEALSEERLEVYTSLLKEQARELEDELAAIPYTPRFAPIQKYAAFDSTWGHRSILDETRFEQKRVALLKSTILEFGRKMEKRDFLERVRDIIAE